MAGRTEEKKGVEREVLGYFREHHQPKVIKKQKAFCFKDLSLRVMNAVGSGSKTVEVRTEVETAESC